MIHGRESTDITSKITAVEIAPGNSGFHLLYLSSTGECLTDGWHESLAHAKRQANFEFEIEDADWQELA